MKETKIVKENVEKYDNLKNKYDETQELLGKGKDIPKYTLGDINDDMLIIEREMLTHKQICQRWLEFLEKYAIHFDKKAEELLEVIKKTTDASKFMDELKKYGKGNKMFPEKITDLKQAIKLYDDAGI